MSSPSSLLKHTTARWRWARSPLRPSLSPCLEEKSRRSTRPPTKALVEAMAGMVSSQTVGGERVQDIREVVVDEVRPPDAVASLWCAGIVGNWASLRHGATLH